MVFTSTQSGIAGHQRIDWVDYAKGICIIAVVVLYCTGGVEEVMNQTGWMHRVVDFAHPFRMPDFFLIAGLFVASTLERPWRAFIDSKILHFIYFYAIWITIEFVLMNWRDIVGRPPLVSLREYALLYLQPEGHLWFIYMLPLYFLLTRLLRPVPVSVVILLAIALKLADPVTGWKMVDRFGMYFVFFYCGYRFAPRLLDLAALVRRHPDYAVAGLAIWALFNGGVVKLELADVPAVHLVMGLAGAVAVMSISVLLAQTRWAWTEGLRHLGQHSIVVYLAFFFPMILARKLILDHELVGDPGHIAFLVSVLAVIGALCIHRAIRATPLRYLLERPSWARLDLPRAPTLKKPLHGAGAG